MAKKKSKTQKVKKSQKSKQKRVQQKLEQTQELRQLKASGATSISKTKKAIKTPTKKKDEKGTTKLVEKDKVGYNIAITKKKPKVKSLTRLETKDNKPKEEKVTLAPKEKVIYNTPIKKEKKEHKKININWNKISKNIKIFFVTMFTAIAVFFKKIVINIKESTTKHKKNKTQKVVKRELDFLIKETKEEQPNLITEVSEVEEEEIDKEELRRRKREETKEKMKRKNIFIRLIYDIVSNRHIFFNAVLILFFIVLLIGLNRIEVISKGTIIYISIISIFLMGVAISYNRYLSGKLFTIVLCAIMGFAIYRMQYTYDFIRNLNSNIYEYKTYYVVTFNNTQNKSIYNINNKKVGLYKENTINIERKLNTKIGNINYIEYDNLNEMFDDFYDQRFRAVLVNENQYKYMKNYINENSRDVKILYEFKANAKK